VTAGPTFVVTLRPEPGIDPTIAIRLLLKYARRLGLTCVTIGSDPPVFNDGSEGRVAELHVVAHGTNMGTDCDRTKTRRRPRVYNRHY
jgi:hypothetical protein